MQPHDWSCALAPGIHGRTTSHRRSFNTSLRRAGMIGA